ncbi:Inward rectifier potassium channel Irk [Chitinophaga parva]|uniref:Inward rectifier potassium channel Irk n=1 Tax=Chitinophaga parva TaxID=2169414 RepID=A0A2T7BDQ8_9BACT|nr:ion channel [Chitinophaga parva]PUZ23229.1 Inward rectifier potassium channel Irk [Chitinophaga parva]
MALLKKINPLSRQEMDTGFGVNSGDYGNRYTNKNGQVNIRKLGLTLLRRSDTFGNMLIMPIWRFVLIIVCFYLAINLVFACIYYFMGMQHLLGVIGNTPGEKFMEAFFFSAQTITTVGYGRVSPVGLATNMIASLESLMGVMSFAIVTGLMYGRFARPRAFLLFSHDALIAPYKDGAALMFRLASFKNLHHLTDTECQVTLALVVDDNGRQVNQFFPLHLERSRISSLALSWTIVHPINADSPLYGMTMKDLEAARAEILVFVRGFDDTFSNVVQQRTSYTYDEIVHGAKFQPMFTRSANHASTLLDLDKINLYDRVPVAQMADV